MSRQHREKVRVELHRRLQRREMDWHARRAWNVDPPLLNDRTTLQWQGDRAAQLTKRILKRGHVKPKELKELRAISRAWDRVIDGLTESYSPKEAGSGEQVLLAIK